MCGRFTLTVETIVISERFHVPLAEFKPRYNIAPTQPCLAIIIGDNQRTAKQMTWGLIPHWSKGKKSPYPLINARMETLEEKPLFRECLKKRRCLIPADGFFEWKKTASAKIPYRVTLKNKELFSFAGLWDTWKGENEELIESFTIITTEANSLVSELHDRMPLILNREDEELWLNTVVQEPAKLKTLMHTYPAEKMQIYPVSSAVNSWKNDTPACIQKVI